VESSRRLSLTPLRRSLLRGKESGKKITPQSSKKGRGRRNFRGGGIESSKEKTPIFIAYNAIEMDMMHPHESCLGPKLSRKEMKGKVKPMTKGEVKHLNPLTMWWHITILE